MIKIRTNIWNINIKRVLLLFIPNIPTIDANITTISAIIITVRIEFLL
jgi:hypothetical protein